MVHAALAVLLLLSGALCASSKRLIAFGDSITDNGNGTNLVVQAFYSKLLGQPVTAVGHACLPPHCLSPPCLKGLKRFTLIIAPHGVG